MNVLLELVNEPLASRVGWVLLHSLWQGAVVGGIFEAARFALRKRSAQSRYLAGCVALVTLLVATIVTFLIESPALPASNAPDPAASGSFPLKIFLPGATEGTGTLEANSFTFLQMGAMILTGIAPWLSALWVIGVVFFCFQLTRSWWWVGKMRSRDNEQMDPAWLERLDALRRRMGVSRPVRLLRSAWVEVPMVIGWLRPVILLPVATMTGLTPSQLEAVLAHELAHVRRFDCVVNAFQCAVEALLFYHPVVWWISGHVRNERENCCDDLVVEVCGDRVVYAQALAALEVSRSELPQLAFAATGGSLLNRIRRLLGSSNAYGPATGRELGGLALLGTGILLIVLGVCLPMTAKLSRSTARILVRNSIVFPESNRGGTHPGSYDPYFIQTEVEVIQSEAVLRRAIDSLDLKSRWGKKDAGGKNLTEAEAAEMLKGRLNLRPVRNSSVIEIEVMDEEPQQAAAMANGIAEAYREYRKSRALELASNTVEALFRQKEEHARRIEAAQAEVDRLRIASGLLPPDPGNPQLNESTNLESTRESVKQLQSSFDYLTDQRIHLESQLSSLLKLEKSQLRDVIPTALEQPDGQLNTLLNELDLAEQRLMYIEKGMTTNHVTFINAKTAIDDLNQKIDKRIEGILLGLQNRIDATRARIVALEERLRKVRSAEPAIATYTAARQKLADLTAAGTALETKIAAEKMDLTLPRTSLVEIVDRAMPSYRPASFRHPTAPSLVLIGLGVLFNLLGIHMLRGRPEAQAALPA